MDEVTTRKYFWYPPNLPAAAPATRLLAADGAYNWRLRAIHVEIVTFFGRNSVETYVAGGYCNIPSALKVPDFAAFSRQILSVAPHSVVSEIGKNKGTDPVLGNADVTIALRVNSENTLEEAIEFSGRLVRQMLAVSGYGLEIFSQAICQVDTHWKTGSGGIIPAKEMMTSQGSSFSFEEGN